MKILVIDDDPAVLQMLALVLGVEGFEVELATDGMQGLVAAAAAPPDVIVLDVMMPGLTGWDVAGRLRELPEVCEVPIIFCTAMAGEEETWRGWRLGAASYVPKPFDNGRLVAEILRAASGEAAAPADATRP